MLLKKVLWEETNRLREFAQVNYTAFYKITKKHDKVMRRVKLVMGARADEVADNLLTLFMNKVDAQSFIRILSNEK